MTLKKGKILGAYDEFDLLILNELRENSKLSVRQLSAKIGLHANTLMQRIKRLEDDKIIVKYAAEIDYSKLGYDLHALIFLKVAKSTREDWGALDKLKGLKGILALYTVTGDYDLVAITKVKDRDGLTQLIRDINKNNFIIETNTNLILSAVKHAYEFNPFKSR